MHTQKKTLKHTAISLLAAASFPLIAFAATQSPTPRKTVAPSLPSSLSEAQGKVEVLAHINEYGFVTKAEISSSSNQELDQSALEAIYSWTFHPATEDGHPVASKALQPFYFDEGTISVAARVEKDTHPKPRQKVSPERSPELANITGEVVLKAALDETGAVTEVQVERSTHEELEASAAAALKQWTFKPATQAGQAVASSVIIPFRFQGSEEAPVIAAKAAKAPIPDRAPKPIRQPEPTLASHLQDQSGEATLRMLVDEHGYVADVEVLESSNDQLAAAAIGAALKWKFKPAIKDGQAVASVVSQPFSFNGGLLVAAPKIDRMPTVKSSKAPELPEALREIKGYVQVRLNLDEQGRVVSATASQSSHDELVAPTLEAAKEWKFKPALREGENVSSTVVIPFVYNEKS